MSQNTKIDSIHITQTVPVSQEDAFELFVKQFSSWYPEAYTWSQEKLDTIAIEPFEGGRCFEQGPHNFELDWGRVLAYEPPKQIIFTWQISYNRQPVPDPEKASEVKVTFTSTSEPGTRIEFEHRGFKNHGENGSKYREMLASPESWPFILDHFKTYVNKNNEE